MKALVVISVWFFICEISNCCRHTSRSASNRGTGRFAMRASNDHNSVTGCVSNVSTTHDLSLMERNPDMMSILAGMQSTDGDIFPQLSPPPQETEEAVPENEPAWLLNKVKAEGAILGSNSYYVGPDRKGDVDKILLEAEAGSGLPDADDRTHARRAARAAVLRERGNTAARGGALDAALVHYGESLALAPNDPAALRNRAHVHLQRGDWAAAEADCTHALQFEPGAPRALFRRAVARLRRGRLRQARADAAAALDADPGNAQACDPPAPASADALAREVGLGTAGRDTRP
jgi:hypothetical protein